MPPIHFSLTRATLKLNLLKPMIAQIPATVFATVPNDRLSIF